VEALRERPRKAPTDRKGSALGYRFSELNHSTRQFLCLRLAVIPREITGKTRGQNGVASPFSYGSLIPYNVPVYPGALCHQVYQVF
jgi:hypothetical protein